jgi:hypothetical protein
MEKPPGFLIELKVRNLHMLKKDLILRNPLRLLGQGDKGLLGPGELGAILARAGVGKTAFLVQLALSSLLNEKRVLHISLNDPVNKVTLWYEEVFRLIAGQYNLLQMNEIWDGILPNRFIMTFQVEGFNAPKLKERLTDLMAQGIFTPDMIIIDGLPFDDSTRTALTELKALAIAMNFPMWFTGRTHRHEVDIVNGLPARISEVSDLFDTILQLQTEGTQIHICAVKGSAVPKSPLLLDPVTLLIQGGE